MTKETEKKYKKFFVVRVNRSRMVADFIKIGLEADSETEAKKLALEEASQHSEWREVDSTAEFSVEYADEIAEEHLIRHAEGCGWNQGQCDCGAVAEWEKDTQGAAQS